MAREIRVLLVEDQFLVGEMIAELVSEVGYKVIGRAMDGQQAVELAMCLRPDVILMDIEMPEMDGIEATRRISETCPTPIVMLTAYETPELVEQASLAGAGAYLVKLPSAREVERAITIAMVRFGDMMELRRLNAELHARNEDLDTFAHTVAHDLQSSISLIIGYANLMLEKEKLSPELARYVTAMARNGHKMSSIINELQLLAGVRVAAVTLTRLDMAAIVAEAQQRLIYMIEEYQAQIILPDDWPEAWGYAPWIEEVWTNYMSNAIKYGGRPPSIKLGAAVEADNMVRFWVQDNGPGLSLEQRAQLFTPFTQLGKVRATGHGLGLSIVRRIVEKLGGKVGVESQGLPGQGSLFIFTLPHKQAPTGQTGPASP